MTTGQIADYVAPHEVIPLRRTVVEKMVEMADDRWLSAESALRSIKAVLVAALRVDAPEGTPISEVWLVCPECDGYHTPSYVSCDGLRPLADVGDGGLADAEEVGDVPE